MCLSALRLYISLQRIFVLLHGSFDFGCQKQFVALCVADIRFCLFHARDLFQHSFQLMQIVEMAARQSCSRKSREPSGKILAIRPVSYSFPGPYGFVISSKQVSGL